MIILSFQLLHLTSLFLMNYAEQSIFNEALLSGQIISQYHTIDYTDIKTDVCTRLKTPNKWHRIHLHLTHPTIINKFHLVTNSLSAAGVLSQKKYRVTTEYYKPGQVVSEYSTKYHEQVEPNISVKRENRMLQFAGFSNRYSTVLSIEWNDPLVGISYCSYSIFGEGMPFESEETVPNLGGRDDILSYKVILGLKDGQPQFSLYDNTMRHLQIESGKDDHVVLILDFGIQQTVGSIVVWFKKTENGAAWTKGGGSWTDGNGEDGLVCDRRYSLFAHVHETFDKDHPLANTQLCSPSMFTPVKYPMARYSNCNGITSAARYLTLTIVNPDLVISLAEVVVYGIEWDKSDLIEQVVDVDCDEKAALEYSKQQKNKKKVKQKNNKKSKPKSRKVPEFNSTHLHGEPVLMASKLPHSFYFSETTYLISVCIVLSSISVLVIIKNLQFRKRILRYEKFNLNAKSDTQNNIRNSEVLDNKTNTIAAPTFSN